MSLLIPSLFLASGTVLGSRLHCHMARLGGVALVGAAIVLPAAPAFADETILAADNGEVFCQASKADLTRISLKDDQFVAVSRVQTGNPAEDFSIVHEPTRGDIYLSVPDDYAKPNISFFGTTQKGFVYKFNCQVGGADAVQVFVANADLEMPQSASDVLQVYGSLENRAVGLVRAMFEQRPVTGFEISDVARAPVNVGDLKVQLISEYRSPTMTGKVLRIDNTSSAPIVLHEELIAGDGAIAVTISNPNLASGQATAAYVVVPSEK